MRKFEEIERTSNNINLILKVDKAGSPCSWVKWTDVVVAEFTDKVIWRMGDPIEMSGGTGRDGNQSKFELYPIVAMNDQSVRKRRTAPPLTNRVLFLRDQHTCAYCEGIFPNSKLSRDHIIPVSRGGQNTYMNCITSCKNCNMRKSDKLLSECGMSLKFKPFVINNFEHLILQNRRILPVQLDYLIKGVSKNFRLPE